MNNLVRWSTLLAVAVVATSCTTLRVESEPAGATVLWSPNGIDGWRPWPPRAWADPQDDPPTTPMRTTGRYGDTVWVTVEKDGYFRPLPQPAQLYLGRREALRFNLAETPAAIEARLLAEGRVPYRGEWVFPEEAGLVEFEGVWMSEADAHAARQRAAGLILFEGEWITPGQREERYAEQQRARGLVEFKGRWVSPEALELEQAIDEEMQRVISYDPRPLDLEPPRVVGSLNATDSQLQIVNSTSVPIRFLFSGPMSRSVTVDPYDTLTQVVLPPGRYDMAAVPQQPRLPQGVTIDPAIPEIVLRESLLRPFHIEHPVAEGFKYLLSFDGGGRLDIGMLGDYVPVSPEIPFEIPRIEIPDYTPPQREVPRRPGGGGPPGGGGGGGRGGGGGAN